MPGGNSDVIDEVVEKDFEIIKKGNGRFSVVGIRGTFEGEELPDGKVFSKKVILDVIKKYLPASMCTGEIKKVEWKAPGILYVKARVDYIP